MAKYSAAEYNYDIYNKELLIIIKVLEEWRLELEGVVYPVKIIMDYKNLKTFNTIKRLMPKYIRWSEFLSKFNFIIKYKPGFTNVRPNILSKKLENTPRDIKNDRFKVRKKLLIDELHFNKLFSIFKEGEDLYIDYIIIAGEPLIIYYLKGKKKETIHINDLINKAYANSIIILNIITAIKIRNR